MAGFVPEFAVSAHISRGIHKTRVLLARRCCIGVVQFIIKTTNMSNPGVVHVLENLFYDWTIWTYKANVSRKKAWCMVFQLKMNYGPQAVDSRWSADCFGLLAKLYMDFPKTSSPLQFTIHFDLMEGSRIDCRNPMYSITGIEYIDGKRIDWEQFTGCEIESFDVAMEHLIKVFKPLINPRNGTRTPLYAAMYANIPAIATNLFNQHVERISRERNKKYNSCFYNKVKLCLPVKMPNDVVWEIAKYGFLSTSLSARLYSAVFPIS